MLHVQNLFLFSFVVLVFSSMFIYIMKRGQIVRRLKCTQTWPIKLIPYNYSGIPPFIFFNTGAHLCTLSCSLPHEVTVLLGLFTFVGRNKPQGTAVWKWESPHCVVVFVILLTSCRCAQWKPAADRRQDKTEDKISQR